LVFQVNDQQLSANQTYTVDFNAKDFNNILGYQFSLVFDNNQLELVELKTLVFTMELLLLLGMFSNLSVLQMRLLYSALLLKQMLTLS